MVCLGNICRSPIAEGVLKEKAKKAGLNWEVDSAGTNGYHIGEPPHRLSQKVAKKMGIDISAQQCRNFSKHDFDDFDKIYAMSADIMEEIQVLGKDKYDASKVDLLLNACYPGQNIDVPDPWFGTEAGYHKVYEMIELACETIVQSALKDKK